jgi:hypothetical protein
VSRLLGLEVIQQKIKFLFLIQVTNSFCFKYKRTIPSVSNTSGQFLDQPEVKLALAAVLLDVRPVPPT